MSVQDQIREILDECNILDHQIEDALRKIMAIMERVGANSHAQGVHMQARALRIRLGLDVPGDHQ